MMHNGYQPRDGQRLRTVPALRFNDERKFTICPECGKYLCPGEVAEQWCEDCGALTPREAQVA